MAGRRPAGIRSGDLSEDMGILLLKAFAAVAPVPRTEDVGVDAVATLLRRADNRMLVAEESFYVQFKARSARTITYEPHELRWLEQLRLPFFIGSVDRADASIELIPGNIISQNLLLNSQSAITFSLDPLPEDPCPQTYIPPTYLGPPFLRWTALDATDVAFAESAVFLMKQYIKAENRNIQYRDIRYYEGIRWETGSIEPKASMAGFFGRATKERVEKALDCLSPYVYVLAMDAATRGSRSDFDFVLDLIAYLRRNGHDTDPDGIYRRYGDRMPPSSDSDP